LRQRVDRAAQPLLEVWLGMPCCAADLCDTVQLRLPVAMPFHLAHPVQRDGDRDGVQPGRECCLATEVAQPVERADERLLCEILREVRITVRHAMAEAVYAVHVLVVQRALRTRITIEYASYQKLLVHPGPCPHVRRAFLSV